MAIIAPSGGPLETAGYRRKAAGSRDPCPLGAAMGSSGFFHRGRKEVLPQTGHEPSLSTTAPLNRHLFRDHNETTMAIAEPLWPAPPSRLPSLRQNRLKRVESPVDVRLVIEEVD
jgi:hypothetical protein